jgi:Nif-specific regulatory protein
MRVITATNVPLKDLVAAGKMRSDFYYRISVIPIQLIPLRQRKMDIPLLAHHFLGSHPVARQKGNKSISRKAMRLLLGYSWPGNIRELQNVLERAMVLNARPTIEHVDLTDVAHENSLPASESDLFKPLKQWLVEKEKQYIAQKLNDLGGNVGLTAKSCRIGVRTLSRKMQQYGLDKAVFKQKDSRSELRRP